MQRYLMVSVCAVAAGVCAWTDRAYGVVFGFESITMNDPTNVAIGEAQLYVEVTQSGPGQVAFRFGTVGADAAVIEQIFFEQGVLTGVVGLTESAGVDFSQDTKKPGNLPGGNSLSPTFDEAFSFSANPPPPFNGVNNTISDSEWLQVVFDLAPSTDFNDVMAGLTDGSFRVGLHAIAFDNGGSESFINSTSPRPVPEPMTALLLLAGIAYARTRRGRTRA